MKAGATGSVRATLIAAVGLVLLMVAIVLGGRSILGREAAIGVEDIQIDDDALDAAPDVTTPQEGDGQTQAIPPAAPPDRAIDPEFENGDAPLERVAPREPLSGIATPARADVPRMTRLDRPVAAAAGRIEAEGHVVELAGIKVLEPNVACPGIEGRSWPCGMVARTAFRSWLRGRTIECSVADRPVVSPEISSCTRAGVDPALWLVENGYAEPLPDGPYVEAGEKARAARRGQFADRPQRPQS